MPQVKSASRLRFTDHEPPSMVVPRIQPASRLRYSDHESPSITVTPDNAQTRSNSRGSTSGSPQRTEDDRCHGTTNIQQPVREPDSRNPSPRASKESFSNGEVDWDKYLPNILRDSKGLTNAQIVHNILSAERALKKERMDLDYWTSASGQAELKKKSEAAMVPPESRTGRWKHQSGAVAAATIIGFLSPRD